MTGFLKITETEVFVTFSLIYVKTNTAVLIAFAHGSKEGQRIFDMIDGIVKLVVNVMGKPINKLLSTTVILSVEQSGEIRQSTESLAGFDLSGGNFTGANFSGRDLSNAIFSSADLTNVNFANANLINTRFTGAILDNTNFENANIQNAVFKDAKKISFYNNFHKGKNVYKANFDTLTMNIIKTPAFYLGFFLGPGLSYNVHQMIGGGDVFANLTGHIGIKAVIKTGYFISLFVDLGYSCLRAKEFDSTTNFTVRYDLHYIYLNLGPSIIFNRFVFYFGVSFNFLLHGKETLGNLSNTNLSSIQRFNSGFVTGIIVKFYETNSYYMFTGIDLKFQLDNFRKNVINDSKIFSVFLTLGMLFSL